MFYLRPGFLVLKLFAVPEKVPRLFKPEAHRWSGGFLADRRKVTLFPTLKAPGNVTL